MLAAADLGEDAAGRREADPHQLCCDVARRRLLIETGGACSWVGTALLRIRVSSRSTAFLHRADFVAPVVERIERSGCWHLQPVVILRQVEVEGAALAMLLRCTMLFRNSLPRSAAGAGR